ncbi:hypothetical protein CFP56_019590 [Quercus suber]|uniref:Uncharacterized protein n=1 Tax=Quercus suber TaxID=58331 RepID=A0AAW0KIF1_QUESU
MLGALTQIIIYTCRMGFAYLVTHSVMSFNLGIFIAALASISNKYPKYTKA